MFRFTQEPSSGSNLVLDVVNIIDHVYNNEHNKEITFVVLAKHKIVP